MDCHVLPSFSINGKKACTFQEGQPAQEDGTIKVWSQTVCQGQQMTVEKALQAERILIL